MKILNDVPMYIQYLFLAQKQPHTDTTEKLKQTVPYITLELSTLQLSIFCLQSLLKTSLHVLLTRKSEIGLRVHRDHSYYLDRFLTTPKSHVRGTISISIASSQRGSNEWKRAVTREEQSTMLDDNEFVSLLPDDSRTLTQL